MIFRKFFIFAIVVCLTEALKAQGEIISEKTVTKQSEVVTEAMDVDTMEAEPVEMENTTENTEQPGKADDSESSDAAKDTPHVLNVMEMSLNDEDKVMLQNLNGIIEKVPEKNNTELKREAKSFKDENLKRAAEALTDDEITEIIKSISFPNDDEISEDSEALKPASDMEVEPRSADGERMGRALKNHGHGYYVIAFTPIEDDNDNSPHESLPYTRLQILPAERSMNGASANPRLISKKSWNRYIRRIMRQIRKGTRKIQRKTKVKTLKEENTVENFLKRMYKISQEKRLKQQQTKKKSSWFIW